MYGTGTSTHVEVRRKLWALYVVAMLAGCLGNSPPRDRDEDAHERVADFSTTAVFLGEYDVSGPYSRVLVPGTLRPRPDEFVTLESATGSGTIRIGIIRPDVSDGERVPILARASSYGHELGTQPLASIGPSYGPSVAFALENFLSNGYALAFIAQRGASGSTGCAHWVDQAADIDQALHWLGEQEWSNGRIGMNGFSFAGGTQWMAAAFENPYLRTIVPMSSVLDRYHEYYKNGTGPSPEAFPPVPAVLPLGPSDPCDNGREREARLHSYSTGERDPGGYWEEQNEKPEILANYTGSVLIVHGLAGDLPPHVIYPWIHELEADGIVVKHLLGQWGHVMPDSRGPFLLTEQDRPVAALVGLGQPNPSPRADWAEILLHWYDYWLKDDMTVDLGPRVQVQDTSGQWRQATAWPPAEAVATIYYLDPGTALSKQGGNQQQSLLIGPDPSWSTATNLPDTIICPGCQLFVTEALASDLHFAGLPRLNLTVVPSGSAGHVVASLYEFGPNGATPFHRHLGCAAMNLAFAAGGETAVPFQPGQPLTVKMEFSPMDVAIGAGNRLALSIGQARTDSCFFDANLHGPQPSEPVTLEVGAKQSSLTLLTFTPDASALFAPPLMDAR